MATNLAIDDSLLNMALQLGGLKTKKDTVNTALQEFIQKLKNNVPCSYYERAITIKYNNISNVHTAHYIQSSKEVPEQYSEQ